MYNKSILDNGLKIITETIPHVRSVSLGIWIYTGSVYETPEVNGISHFIEHMLFKGTVTRNAKELATQVDSVGGQLDAFTGREFTCVNVKIMDKHLPLAINIITDMLQNSTFDEEDIEREKKVVLEEINLNEDTPDEYIHDLFAKSIWSNQSMGYPILGSKKNVSNFNRKGILDYFERWYHPSHMLVTAAGNIEHNALVSQMKNSIRAKKRQRFRAFYPVPKMNKNIKILKRDLEQVHFCLGTGGLPGNHENRFALHVLNSVIGGSMSSRLFQEIREQQALVYTIFSYQISYSRTGIFAIYGGTSPENFDKVLKEVHHQLTLLKEKKISKKELSTAKEQLKGSLMLALESTSSRMHRLSQLELYFGRVFTLDETIEQIDNVTCDNVYDLINTIFSDKLALTAIGNIPEDAKYDKYLTL